MRIGQLSRHALPVGVLLLLVALVSGPILELDVTQRGGDWCNSDTPGFLYLEKSIRSGTLWLWDHLTFSGRPLFGFAMPLGHPLAILLVALFGPYVALNLMVILHFALAGVSMYVLALDTVRHRRAALAAAVVFLVSPFLFGNSTHPFWVFGTSYLPLALWLAIRARREQSGLRWIVALAIVLALQFLSGGVLQWYYTVGFVAFYLLYESFATPDWPRGALRPAGVLAASGILLFGLVLVRLLPAVEWTSFTNRGAGLPVEEIMRVGHLDLDNFLDTFVHSLHPESKAGSRKYGQIGWLGLLLMLGGIGAWFRHRHDSRQRSSLVPFLVLGMLLTALFASGVLLESLYSVPGMRGQRGLDRSLVIYVACASLLVAHGVEQLLEGLARWGPGRRVGRIVFPALLALMVLELFRLSLPRLREFRGAFEPYQVTENNPIFLRMAEDPDVFRFHVVELVGVDWNNFLGASIPHELESVYGSYGGGWDSRYFHQFLGTALHSPTVLWGMLNVKYFISSNELEHSDVELLETFESVPTDTISKRHYGAVAHLYRNQRFLPRAATIPAATVLIGDPAETERLMYTILPRPSFDPARNLIVLGRRRVSDYALDELRPYDLVILAAGALEKGYAVLEEFAAAGGTVFPDVFQRQPSFTGSDLDVSLSGLNELPGALHAVPVVNYFDETPNRMTLDVSRTPHPIVFVSEKFTLYPGWSAQLDGRDVEIHRANGVLSAVSVPPGSRELVFEYRPRSFERGLVVTMATTFLIVLVLIVPPLLERFRASR